MPESTAYLRERVANQLAQTLDQRAAAKTRGEGYTGLDGEIRNLAAALRELDAALAIDAHITSGAPLFSLNPREFLDEAAHRG